MKRTSSWWPYVLGSGIVTLWTVLKFVVTPTVFDLVGQQVVAAQMLAGRGSGAVLGTTNYLWKILVLYMPLHALPGSPRLKLLLLTCVVNIATFVVMGVLLRKILQELGAKSTAWFNAALLWLACLAGSVFWIEFTNSRNLEAAGGLLLVWLGLKYSKKPSWWFAALLAAYASVLFFADTLQLYMAALPLLVYAAAVHAKQWREQWRMLVGLAAVLAIGFVGAKGWFALSAHLFGITYLKAKSTVVLNPLPLLVPTAKAYAHLLLGGVDGGRLREAVNGLLFAGLAAAGVWAAVRKKLPGRVVLYAVCVLALDTAVFIGSDFVAQGGTERYLIMTMPALMLIVGVLPAPKKLSWRRAAYAAFALVVLINVAALGHALIKGWPDRFQTDDHTMLAVQYVKAHRNEVIFSSMDTALPGAYLSGNDSDAPLPLSCEANGVTPSYLFYAKQAYDARTALINRLPVTFILDGDAITNAPAICTAAQIERQVGQPTATTTLSDGSLVLHYAPDATDYPRP